MLRFRKNRKIEKIAKIEKLKKIEKIEKIATSQSTLNMAHEYNVRKFQATII